MPPTKTTVPHRAVRILAQEGMDPQVAVVLVRLMYRQGVVTTQHNAGAIVRQVWDWCRVDGVNAHVTEVRDVQMQRPYVSDVHRGAVR